MNVIITIRGREAIPIRAIPFATGFRAPADALCQALAHDSPTGLPILWDATAYQLDEYGNPVALWPKDWDAVTSAVADVSDELDDEGATGESRNQSWLARSTLALPAGCFMWLDELRESFRRGVSRRLTDHERKGDSEIQRYPLNIPEDLRAFVMEGFERFIQSPPSEMPLPAVDPAPVADPALIVPALTAEPAPGSDAPAPVAKSRRKPTKKERLRLKLEAIIEVLEHYAQQNGEQFDRFHMPGPMPGEDGKAWEETGSFHWLCATLHEEFKMPYSTFEKYRRGICAGERYAKACNFYARALPVCRQFIASSITEQKRE